jgi:carbohydrate diacid regulator
MQVIEQAEKYLKKSVSDLNALNLYYKAGSTLVCAVIATSDTSAESLAKELKKQVEEKYPVYLAIGIDSKVGNFEIAQTALIRAQKANKACMRTHKRDIRFYDDLNMEVFTDEISELSKQEFIHRIFKGFSNEEIRHSMILLETLYDLEGSINQASERLFIHKNTLQNKLKRIAERTGYDPRSIRHSSLFYIAIYFYRDIYDSMQNL